MVLSLETPVGSNFLQDFPAQNSNNLDEIDAYANASLTSHPLKTYTPIFRSTGVSDPIIGTGGPAVLRSYYYEIFDQLFIWGEFRFGTTGPSSGNGTWNMTLPFTVNSITGASTIVGESPVIGGGNIWCNSTATNRQPVLVHLRTSNTMMFSVRMTSGAAQRELTHNAPIAWAPSDGLSWYARIYRLP